MRRVQLLVTLLAVALVAALTGLGAAPAGADGAVGVVNLGSAPRLGAPAGALGAPLVGIAGHPSANGYWLVGRDGGIFTYGASRFYGSTGAITLARPIVGMAPTPTGRGYWLVAEDGGVFSFGDARFHGSTGGLWIGTTVVGIVATPSGHGYALAGADGQIFSFGDATRAGSGPLSLASPITDIEITASGRGYWLLGGDGAVFAYGDARFHGGVNPWPVEGAGLARTPDGGGYWVAVNALTGPPAPAGSGSGRRIVYSNSQQRVWLVDGSNHVEHTWLVSGRRGVPAPGTYHIYSKSPVSSAGSLRLNWMSRFYRASSGKSVGFHGIPLRPNGTPIQSDAELGQYRSHGCVRMNQQAVKVVYDWAPLGTTVVVLP